MSSSEPRSCPRCGAGYEALQEYCLECGDRLPTNRGAAGVLAAAWQRRFPWYPGDWVWPALLFLVVALVATAVAAATSSSGSGTTIVAIEPNVAVGPGTNAAAVTVRRTLPAAPKPAVTTGPLPKAPGAPSTEARVPPAPVGLTAWPVSGSAYTDVLESVPLASGRTIAVARARAAKAAGLPQAGVLVSSGYPSLHPGYYVVFSGIYGTSQAASAALAAARGKGFSGAYVARVTHG